MSVPTQPDVRTPRHTGPAGPVAGPAVHRGLQRVGSPTSPGVPHRPVSPDELEMIALFADGLPIDAIARRLDLSDRTVRRRSRALCDRLGARATIQVVAWAARNRLI